MKRNYTSIIAGVIFLIAAAAFVLGSAGVIDFSFQTFWPLIFTAVGIPGIFKKEGRIFSLGLIAVGVLLTLRNCGVAPFATLPVWQGMILPVLLCVIGLGLIFPVFKIGSDENRSAAVAGSADEHSIKVTFGERYIDYTGVEFSGADIECSFGQCTVDLKQAVINADCAITVNCAFGEVRILTGSNVRCVVNGSQAFGSVSGGASQSSDTALPCVTVTGSASFGSIDVK